MWCPGAGRARCCWAVADPALVGAADARRPVGGGSRPRRGVWLLGVLVVVAAVVGGLFVWRSVASGDGGRRAAAERFLTGWTRRDWAVMWQALTPSARATYPEARFAAAYRSADRAACSLGAGREAGGGHDGEIAVPVWVGTAEFGTLRGTVVLPVSGSGDGAGVDWDPSLRLPGLRRRERVHTRSGPRPRRGAILAADGTPLGATAVGASIAGQVAPTPSGLEGIYNRRLGGRPSAGLLFGKRVIARAPRIPGRSLPTTISPRLMRRRRRRWVSSWAG